MHARNRWGAEFRKGDKVVDSRGWEYRYVKLEAPDDFSRAYGRQAIVCCDLSGPLTHDRTVGIDDLRKVSQ